MLSSIGLGRSWLEESPQALGRWKLGGGEMLKKCWKWEEEGGLNTDGCSSSQGKSLHFDYCVL